MSSGNWAPTTVLRVIRSFPTGSEVVRVETDQGEAYLKALGNAGGPHVLACEWTGTHLARWMGLPTLEFALIGVTQEDEIPFAGGKKAEPGPAFISRAERGIAWGGRRESLEQTSNPSDVNRLVVFDTWTLNCDRHHPDSTQRKPNRDNVFLSQEGGKPGQLVLKAIDHGHCFTCGRDLTPSVGRIDLVNDARVYGLFDEFWPLMDRTEVQVAATHLRALEESWVRSIVEAIPVEWSVDSSARTALVRLICDRARYVADHIVETIWPQRELGFDSGETP